MIIGLAGYARSGKDTIGSFLVERHGFIRYAFADALKELALKVNPLVLPTHTGHLMPIVAASGWEEAKRLPETRLFLQHLGAGCRDIFGEDVWLKVVEKKIYTARWSDHIVVTDVRFPNEANMIRQYGGEVWRVERPGFGPINSHISETAMDLYDYDGRFLNDGTIEDLHQEVEARLRLPVPEAIVDA